MRRKPTTRTHADTDAATQNSMQDLKYFPIAPKFAQGGLAKNM